MTTTTESPAEKNQNRGRSRQHMFSVNFSSLPLTHTFPLLGDFSHDPFTKQDHHVKNTAVTLPYRDTLPAHHSRFPFNIALPTVMLHLHIHKLSQK